MKELADGVVSLVSYCVFGGLGAVFGAAAFYTGFGRTEAMGSLGLVVGGAVGVLVAAIQSWSMTASVRRQINLSTRLVNAARFAASVPNGDLASPVFRLMTAETLGRAVGPKCLSELQEHGCQLVAWLRVAQAEQRPLGAADYVRFSDGVKRILDNYPTEGWSLAAADPTTFPRREP